MRNAFIEELTRLAKDARVLALLADNGIIVFDEYKEKFPRQFLNLGIAESNMIGMAAGLASCGYIPFVYTIIPFLTLRPYEFIRNDICYQKRNVKLVGIGAGFSYSTLGPTHHGTEDVSVLRCLENMVVISPGDPVETVKATSAAYEYEGPVYIRIGTGNNKTIFKRDDTFQIGKGVVLKDGGDVSVFTTGTILPEVLEAAIDLEHRNISIRVVHMPTLNPIDKELIVESAEKTGRILTIEEHSIIGGLGSAVAEILLEEYPKIKSFKRLGLNGYYCHGYGSLSEVRRVNGLSKEQIVQAMIDHVNLSNVNPEKFHR